LTTLVEDALALLGIKPATSVSTPLAPLTTTNPVLESLYTAHRRLQTQVGKTGPTGTVTQVVQHATGEVTGTIVASDANGDPVTMRVSMAPTNGTAVIDSAGNFTYLPNTNFAAQGGTDTFTVTLNDARRSLLQNLFGGARKTTVPVTVTVSPTNEVRYHFTVINLTSEPLKYRGLSINDGGDAQDGEPPVGSLLLPGQSATFGLTYYFLYTTQALAEFGVGNNTFSAKFVVPGGAGAPNYSSCRAQSGKCSVSGQSGVDFLDQPGTVLNLNPQQAQAQSATLDSLCSSGRADCHVDLTSEVHTFSTPQVIDQTSNNGPEDQSSVLTGTQTITETDSVSVGGKSSASIAKLFSAEVSATYGRSVVQTRTFTQSINVTLAGRTKDLMIAEQPVIRDYGNLTITVGNSTIHAEGAYLDSPDPGGQSRYTVQATNLSPAAPTVPNKPATTPLTGSTALTDLPRSLLASVLNVITHAAGTLVNQPPSASATNVTQSTSTGLVTGTIVASGPNGDPVTMRVSRNPYNGSVTLSPNGAFTYTPTAEFAAIGGTDTFDVTVNDAHPALLSLFTGTGQTTIPVVVSVAPNSATVSTAGFDIVDASSVPLRFQGFSYNDGTVINAPKVGSILKPGQVAHFDIESPTPAVGKSVIVTAEFATTTGPALQFSGQMIQNALDGRSVNCSKSPNARCYTTGSNTINFVDPAGTTITLAEGQGGDLLNTICGAAGTCTMDFPIDPTTHYYVNPVPVDGPKHAVGAAIVNHTQRSVSTSVSTTDTQSVTTNVTVAGKVSANFLGYLNAEFNATYGHSITQTVTFTKTLTVNVPRGETRAVVVAEPFQQYTGNATIKLGNTTWYLNNLKIDVPDPTRPGNYEITTDPLST
jgi:hypothetical protein